MDKKIAIASCYFQPNYGSQLQAYATQKILDDLGVENETICIDGFIHEINQAKYKYFLRMLLDPATVKGKLGFVKHKLQLKLNKSFGANVTTRNEMFKSFSSEMFKLSPKYNSKAELGDNCKQYSAVMVGSDQLWLPSNIEADYYTLNFVPSSTPKIAFATSFGISKMPKAQENKTATFLNRIDYLSTRENSGQEIIQNLTGKDVPIVCDPTLLFTADEWLQIQDSNRIVEENYIFCYFLGNNPEQRNFVRQLKEKTGYKIVQLPHLDEYIKSDESFADYKLYDIGPKEYLNLIRNAEIICADSFHGTVFSILHKKPFFTFPRFQKNTSVSTNSRLNSILSLLNLTDRFIVGEKSVEACLNKQIDYDLVHNKLSKFRKESKLFLKNSLIKSGVSI